MKRNIDQIIYWILFVPVNYLDNVMRCNRHAEKKNDEELYEVSDTDRETRLRFSKFNTL